MNSHKLRIAFIQWTLMILFPLFFSNFCKAQDTIRILNKSFESIEKKYGLPELWFSCTFKGESDPRVISELDEDVPDPYPINGLNYVKFETRKNDTWDRYSQKLTKKLVIGKKYSMKIFLANPAKAGEDQSPIVLRLWGNFQYCVRQELLAETPPIDHSDWREYEFIFTPIKDHGYIMIEGFYDTPVNAPYDGSIIIDMCSDIIEVIE